MDMAYRISRMQREIDEAREREQRKGPARIGMGAMLAEMQRHSTPPPPLDGPAYDGYLLDGKA